MGIKKIVSDFFKRDKTIQVAQKAKGTSVGDINSIPYNNLSYGGSEDSIRAASSRLGIEYGLLERYSDYENMDDYGEITVALDIMADDSTITDNVKGKSIWAVSTDTLVRDIIDDLLHRILRIEEDIWSYTRNLCKLGNFFAEVVISNQGVVGLNPLPPATMRRIVDRYGVTLGYIQDMSGQFSITLDKFEDKKSLKNELDKRNLVFFEPWEVVHFRLSSKYVKSIYGISCIDSARWIFKRLIMFEDTVLLYRLSKSPGRNVFYVDTGDLPPAESNQLVRKVQQSYKKKQLVNPSTGQIELRNNVLTPQEDIFIPTRGGKESTRVDILSGPDWNVTDDLEYWRDKLFTSLKVPKAYFGGDADASQSLAQRDVRFARTCLRIQREIRNGFRHVVRVHLAILGIDPDTVDWELKMSSPSSILELQQIETMNARAGLVSALADKLPMDWLLKNVLHLSQDDADSVKMMKSDETEQSLDDQARIAYELQKKYPGIAIQPTGEMQASQPETSNESIKDDLNKIKESLKENIQSNYRVVKKIEEDIGPLSRIIRRARK